MPAPEADWLLQCKADLARLAVAACPADSAGEVAYLVRQIGDLLCLVRAEVKNGSETAILAAAALATAAKALGRFCGTDPQYAGAAYELVEAAWMCGRADVVVVEMLGKNRRRKGRPRGGHAAARIKAALAAAPSASHKAIAGEAHASVEYVREVRRRSKAGQK